MKKKSVSRICLVMLMGTSICMSSTGMVFAAEETENAAEASAETDASESTGEEGLVDLTAFCTDGEYRYKGIPWLSSREEIEEATGVTLPEAKELQPEWTNLEKPVEFQGESGYMEMNFLKDGVTDVTFCFGAEPEEMEEYDGDLTELSGNVLYQLTEQYGEPTRTNENTADNGGAVKNYQWREEKDGDTNSVLNMQCLFVPDEERMYRLSFGVGSIREAFALRRQLGYAPEEEIEETETSAEESKVSSEASENTDEEEFVDLDLTAFCTDGEYGYKGIPWLASLEEAEETLGVSLEPMMEGMNTQMGSFVAPVEFRGESGYIGLGLLDDGVTDISFWFGTDSNNKDKYDGNLIELSDYVLEQFTELYGEPDEVKDNGGFKGYQWHEVEDGEVKTALSIQCMYDQAGKRVYSLAVGAIGREATIQLMQESGKETETTEEAESTEKTDTSAATE